MGCPTDDWEPYRAVGGQFAVPGGVPERGGVEGVSPLGEGKSLAGEVGALAPRVRLVYPPWVYRIPGKSQYFRLTDFAVALPAVAGGSVIPASLILRLPIDMMGWLQYVSIYALSTTSATAVSWTIRLNEAPVAGLDNLRNPPGVMNIMLRETTELQVRIPPGSRVDMVIQNVNGAGPWTVGGELAGWYHAVEDEATYWGSML